MSKKTKSLSDIYALLAAIDANTDAATAAKIRKKCAKYFDALTPPPVATTLNTPHGPTGDTILAAAIRADAPALVSRLLATGADPSSHGGALLDVAIGTSPRVAAALIPGLPVETLQPHLVPAARSGSGQVLKALAEAGVDVRGKDANDETALAAAYAEGDAAFATALTMLGPFFTTKTPNEVFVPPHPDSVLFVCAKSALPASALAALDHFGIPSEVDTEAIDAQGFRAIDYFSHACEEYADDDSVLSNGCAVVVRAIMKANLRVYPKVEVWSEHLLRLLFLSDRDSDDLQLLHRLADLQQVALAGDGTKWVDTLMLWKMTEYKGKTVAECVASLASHYAAFRRVRSLTRNYVGRIQQRFAQVRELSLSVGGIDFSRVLAAAAEGIDRGAIVLNARAPRLLVLGSTSSGKSTFLNVLIGAEVLKMDDGACTRHITEIEYDSEVSLLYAPFDNSSDPVYLIPPLPKNHTNINRIRKMLTALAFRASPDVDPDVAGPSSASSARAEASALIEDAYKAAYFRGEMARKRGAGTLTPEEATKAADGTAYKNEEIDPGLYLPVQGHDHPHDINPLTHRLILRWPSAVLAGLTLVDAPGFDAIEELDKRVAKYARTAIGVMVMVRARGQGLEEKPAQVLAKLLSSQKATDGGDDAGKAAGEAGEDGAESGGGNKLSGKQVFVVLTMIDKCEPQSRDDVRADVKDRIVEVVSNAGLAGATWDPDTNFAEINGRGLLETLLANRGHIEYEKNLSIIGDFLARMYSLLLSRVYELIERPSQMLQSVTTDMEEIVSAAPSNIANSIVSLKSVDTVASSVEPVLKDELTASLAACLNEADAELEHDMPGVLIEFVQKKLDEFKYPIRLNATSRKDLWNRLQNELRNNVVRFIQWLAAERMIVLRNAAGRKVSEVMSNKLAELEREGSQAEVDRCKRALDTANHADARGLVAEFDSLPTTVQVNIVEVSLWFKDLRSAFVRLFSLSSATTIHKSSSNDPDSSWTKYKNDVFRVFVDRLNQNSVSAFTLGTLQHFCEANVPQVVDAAALWLRRTFDYSDMISRLAQRHKVVSSIAPQVQSLKVSVDTLVDDMETKLRPAIDSVNVDTTTPSGDDGPDLDDAIAAIHMRNNVRLGEIIAALPADSPLGIDILHEICTLQSGAKSAVDMTISVINSQLTVALDAFVGTTTCLYEAVARGHLEVANILLDAGASPLATTSLGGSTTVFDTALRGGFLELCQRLARDPRVAEAVFGRTDLLHVAVSSGSCATVRWIVTNPPTVTRSPLTDSLDGNTVLHTMARQSAWSEDDAAEALSIIFAAAVLEFKSVDEWFAFLATPNATGYTAVELAIVSDAVGVVAALSRGIPTWQWNAIVFCTQNGFETVVPKLVQASSLTSSAVAAGAMLALASDKPLFLIEHFLSHPHFDAACLPRLLRSAVLLGSLELVTAITVTADVDIPVDVVHMAMAFDSPWLVDEVLAASSPPHNPESIKPLVALAQSGRVAAVLGNWLTAMSDAPKDTRPPVPAPPSLPPTLHVDDAKRQIQIEANDLLEAVVFQR